MIKKNEINKIAQALNVRTSTVDKDWVLGHFIDAIYSTPECLNSLIFKGGTCLKKCRFPDFRFSEDLYFTSTNPTFRLTSKLLENIVLLVTERTGLPLFVHSLEDLRFKNVLTGFASHIRFWGADHRQDQQPPDHSRWTSSIKIEIILYEQMIFEPEKKEVFHHYSDFLSDASMSVPCYSIHEVLAEKLRALIQRSYTAPRDYYDIWYLSNSVPDIDWKKVVVAFHQKMAFKGLTFTSIEQLINSENDRTIKASWKNNLQHQIISDKLPTYENVKSYLTDLFSKIFQ